jgi:peptide/nickel transport system ATP-binding protein
MSKTIIEAKAVSKRFTKTLDFAGRMAARLGADLREETVHAVERVSLAIKTGEVVGLVGESGCGKSTLGRMIAGILPQTEGVVLYKGCDRATLNATEAKAARLAVQMIFQDPYASLNPRARVESIVGEAPLVHGLTTRREMAGYVADVLNRVGLDPSRADREAASALREPSL